MQPDIHLNPLAIPAAAVAAWILGALWYGPLFGKAWASGMGYPPGFKPTPAEMGKGIALQFVGLLLMAFVMAHDVQVWRPSVWKAGPDQSPAVYGFFAGLFLWLGFVVPMLLNSVAFERKTWKVFGINAGYQFASLQCLGMILSFWR